MEERQKLFMEREVPAYIRHGVGGDRKGSVLL